jgi:superfamily II DNA or RNA helicase
MVDGEAGGEITLAIADDAGGSRIVALSPAEVALVEVLTRDRSADSARVLAGMWTHWMSASNHNARTTMLAATTLRPYIHQANAVYGAMLPQPLLRFLLADEPGTGKTIMAGMYLRELQRLGIIRKALVVAPAGLVTKWQADFDRFFGGGLRRVTADTVREHALDVDHDMWVVSLELAAMNGNVQDALRPDKAGWDIVVFDEAHRLTPTATSLMRVGRLLAVPAPRTLLMTATPHRGSEWYFRHLLHLVDPEVYPDPGMAAPKEEHDLPKLKPGAIHYLRRMKESLVHNDGQTRLFKGRKAENLPVPLSPIEDSLYNQALELVDLYFPPSAQPLARMVYGKRAASTLHALRETLIRRRDHMGDTVTVSPDTSTDPYDPDVIDSEEEAKVTHADSLAARQEKIAISDLVVQLEQLLGGDYTPSKWKQLTGVVLRGNGIEPGNAEQAVVFTEYADSAMWIEKRLIDDGYTARVYSGRLATAERDQVREAFMRGEYQIIVSTDAGNEGIDLQSANVLTNYDIPWSLVRLEQRMGRIHRVGQEREVYLYNLVATDTREGDTILRLLDNFVTAANEMDGQLFDSLSLVAELSGVTMEQWLSALYGNDPTARRSAIEAAAAVRAVDLKNRAIALAEEDKELASTVDARAALTLMQDDLLERINPAIVEAYLRRLDEAGVLAVQGTAHDSEGILRLTRTEGLPISLTGRRGATAATIATSGEVLAKVRRHVDTSGVVILGPGEPAFSDLIALSRDEFDPDLYRGGAVQDVTSLTDYDLYAFSATFTESGGRKTTQWASLIRVDADRSARRVRWETLANLTPSAEPAGPANPLTDHRAIESARDAAKEDESEQKRVRREWFTKARSDLTSLPYQLTKNLTGEQRVEQYGRIKNNTQRRLDELERLIEVSVTQPRLVGHLQVHGTAAEPPLEEKNSELIAVYHVATLLAKNGWDVTDVQTEGRGYDLRARKGASQRLVEVKGVWRSAAVQGVRMTGNEVLMATQHRDEYWLYVVDECQSGGTLFGAFPDPIGTLGSAMTGEAVIKIPGRALRKHAGEGDRAH